MPRSWPGSHPDTSTPTRVASVVPLVPAWRVDKTFDYSAGELDVVPGSLVRMPFGHRAVRGVVVSLREGDATGLEAITAVVGPAPVAPGRLPELFDWIATRYVAPRGRVFARAVPPRVRVRVEPPPRRASVEPQRLLAYPGGEALLETLTREAGGAFAICTVPGEDRGRLIAELVAASPSSALVTVPEVRYGSMVLDSLATHIGPIARLDSARPESERATSWFALSAHGGVGGGGRSAVLAPCDPLGLIVVDEEHHHTYKEDRSPRYDARRVAVERARLQGAACVLISPCPTMETGRAIEDGTITGLFPAREARRAARPTIEIVGRPQDRSLSHELHERVAATLRAGGRAALLVPSGAFARAVWCASCRRSLRCPQCEAGLFYSAAQRQVRCARCGYRSPAPEKCPTCGAADFRFVGAGSERLAQQLEKAFPRARIARVDPSDPASVPGDVDLYVTTWIGTKPELRPDVSLVGVLDADWLIRRPDFRSAETAHQALVEMAEWAGPAREGGRLLVQTSDPTHHAVQAVVRADYLYFLARELEIRRELMYPPFTELVRLTATGPEAVEVLRSVAGGLGSRRVRVLGPVRSTPPAAGHQMLLKCESAQEVAGYLRDILPADRRDARVSIDVDPR